MKNPKEIVKALSDVLLKAQEVVVEETVETPVVLAEEPMAAPVADEEVVAAPVGDFVTKQELNAIEGKISKLIAELSAKIEQFKDLKDETPDVPAELSAVETPVVETPTEVVAAPVAVAPEVVEDEVVHSPEAEVVTKPMRLKTSKKTNTRDAVMEMLFGDN